MAFERQNPASCEIFHLAAFWFFFHGSVSLWRLRRDGPRLFRRSSQRVSVCEGEYVQLVMSVQSESNATVKHFQTDPFLWESSCCAAFIDYPPWVFFLCLSWAVIVSYLSHSSGPFASRSLCFASPRCDRLSWVSIFSSVLPPTTCLLIWFTSAVLFGVCPNLLQMLI